MSLAVLPLLGYLVQRARNSKAKGSHHQLYIGIELGGTNFNVAVAEPVLSNQGEVIDFRIIKKKNGTTYHDPSQSIAEIIEFIESVHEQPLTFIGIASFGPLCLEPDSPLFGTITTTPKQLWRNINVLQSLAGPFPQASSSIDTDVNAAAYAEFKLGNHGVRESLAYITVGTGVGVGLIVNGKTVHGLTHPEGGHVM